MKSKLWCLLWIGFYTVGCSFPTTVNPPITSPTVAVDFTVPSQAQSLPIAANITLNDQVIALEVAKTPDQQAIGLMHRQSLAENRGMLFVFDPPRPVRFWMKNVNFPLDMIFVRDGQIKSILSKVPPCALDPCPTYGPASEVDGVIELVGGRAQALGIAPGDRLSVEWLKTP